MALNSLRHGFYAKTAILPGENQHEFDQVFDQLDACWQPQNESERHLGQLATSYWSQLRVGCRRLLLLEQHLGFKEEFLLLDRLDLQLARHQRSYSRALKDLRSLQKDRLQAQAAADLARKNAGQRDYHPVLVSIDDHTGKRTAAADPAACSPVVRPFPDAAIRAINEVNLNHYLLKPWDPPEQNLYPVLDDLLEDWQAGYRPAFEGIRVNSWRAPPAGMSQPP